MCKEAALGAVSFLEINMHTAADNKEYSPHVYRDALERVGAVISYTRGISMRPLIYEDTCFVAVVKGDADKNSPLSPDGYKVDDMLLFEQVRDGKTVGILHRLIRIEQTGEGRMYVTRGDNCLGCERFAAADIIGRAENVYWRIPPRRSLRLRFLVPRMLGATVDNGCYVISVNDKGYLRYVRFWNAAWPLRRWRLMVRTLPRRLCPAPVYRRLRRIPWLRRALGRKPL